MFASRALKHRGLTDLWSTTVIVSPGVARSIANGAAMWRADQVKIALLWGFDPRRLILHSQRRFGAVFPHAFPFALRQASVLGG